VPTTCSSAITEVHGLINLVHNISNTKTNPKNSVKSQFYSKAPKFKINSNLALTILKVPEFKINSDLALTILHFSL
jgi:hypothetical protein